MCSESSNESYHLYMNYKGEVYPCQELVSSRYLLADCVSGINDSIAERCHSIVYFSLPSPHYNVRSAIQGHRETAVR